MQSSDKSTPDFGAGASPFLFKAAVRRYAMTLGMALAPLSCLRVAILKFCGVKVGRGCYLGFHVMCDTNFPGMISIGDNVTISHGTQIYAHTMTPAKSRLAGVYNHAKPVKISDGAWIGAGCLVLPGVTVGEDCMVGAGSVVCEDTDPSSVYAGNPCRKVKSVSFA